MASGWKLCVLLAVTVSAGLWSLVRSPWYAQRQWAHIPLADLLRQSAAHQNDPVFLYYLGLHLNEAHRYAEAAPVLERSVGLDPDAPGQRDQWATSLLGTGQVSAAFVELRQFVGIHPRSAPGHLALGKFYMTQRARARAVDEFAAATTLEPANGEAWSYLASARSNMDDAAGALPAAERAVSLRPRSVVDRLLLASINGRLNRTDPARAAYEAACSLGPELPETHRELAQWLLDHPANPQDGARAEAEARRAVALNDHNAKAWLILGRILARDHRDAEAIAPLERSTAIDPINPAPLLALQQVCHRLGRADEMRHWSALYLKCQQQNELNGRLQDEISKNPTDPKPHRELARLMAEWGDVVECLKHEASALRCPRDTPPALLAAARDLLAVGRPEDALSLVNQTLLVAADDPAAHELRGDSLLALGQLHEAAVEYDVAVRAWPEREPAYRSKLQSYIARRHQSAGLKPAPATAGATK